MNWFFRRPKIGLALGSGGPRGLAHIGVIKALIRHHIPIDYVAGSSAGALIGSFYCAKKNIDEMEKYICDQNWWQIVNIFLNFSFAQGLVRGTNFKKYLQGYLGDKTFTDLQVPFTSVAVDLKTGALKLINNNNVVTAVLASCSMPPVFLPVTINNEVLVDGAILMPVPTTVVRKMGADIVIGVNLNSKETVKNLNMKINFYTVSRQAIYIMLNNIANIDLKSADVVVSPPVEEVHWRSLFNDQDKKEAIRSGEAAMEKVMPRLKSLIALKSTQININSSIQPLRLFISKLLSAKNK